ncbi:hypothetical protein O988_05234 [Pseudogymnoascus sp. VKM F-3808]|nr:hypothetical protein O988_05234 [Pseudogymnoascus sp. VKM F-3808]
MKVSSIFPLLAALTATVRAELATGNYYINSMVEERYYLSVYDKSNNNIQKRIKLREEKPDEPWRLVAEPDGFFTLSIRDLELGEDGDVVFAVDDRPPFHWSIEPANPNDPTVYIIKIKYSKLGWDANIEWPVGKDRGKIYLEEYYNPPNYQPIELFKFTPAE